MTVDFEHDVAPLQARSCRRPVRSDRSDDDTSVIVFISSLLLDPDLDPRAVFGLHREDVRRPRVLDALPERVGVQALLPQLIELTSDIKQKEDYTRFLKEIPDLETDISEAEVIIFIANPRGDSELGGINGGGISFSVPRGLPQPVAIEQAVGPEAHCVPGE